MSKAIEPRVILPDPGEIIVTRDQMTLLMLESHKKSVNAAEEILALKEIAKLHKLYEVAPLVQINNIQVANNQKKLETMSDDDLMQLAGNHPYLFDVPAIENKVKVQRKRGKKKEVEIEANFEEIED